MRDDTNRRNFIKNTAFLSLGSLLLPKTVLGFDKINTTKVKLCGHLWVYASNYPPNWDCSPILEQVFSDMSYAGLYGVELMEVVLRPDDAVTRISEYSKKHDIKVSGSSYGVGFQMCDRKQHPKIWEDIQLVVPRLAELGGETFGISVGGVGRKKTELELDDQAELLKKIIGFCEVYGIQPNLHNHTYEVEYDLHDLKGTLERIPEAKLGPDINWLIRAGVDPVEFIQTYGDKFVYLHIRDQYDNGEWTEYVGQGTTDFNAIGKVLKAKGFHGMAGIELAFPNGFEPEFPLKEDWKKSREYVQRIFNWS
ncbi:hypothetical protein FGF1_09140 [Flavobacteriaceae bacterium GF1]